MTHQHAELLAAISKPLPWDQVEVKVQAITKDKSKALPVLYMDARAATRRLNDVFGLNWSALMREVLDNGRIVGVACTLTVTLPGGTTQQRCNVGELSEGDSRGGDGDDDGLSKNSLKGAYSDALKRALAQLGCDCLYQVELPWVAYTGNKFAPFDPETLTRIKSIYERQMGLGLNTKPSQTPPKAPPIPSKAGPEDAGWVKVDTPSGYPSKESRIFTEELRSQPPPPKDSGEPTIGTMLTILNFQKDEALALFEANTGRKFLNVRDAAARLTPDEKVKVSAALKAEIALRASGQDVVQTW